MTRRSGDRTMRWLCTWVVTLALVGLGGCGPKTLSVRYTASGITPLPQLLPVAVYQLVDKRGEDEPTRIGGVYGGYRNLLNRLYGDEPAAVTVTRALADGLKARGFPVIDMTTARFDPAATRAQVRVVVSGEVREFWTEAFYTNQAKCSMLLQLYETATGRKLWEKEYAEKFSGGLSGGVFASSDDLRDNLARLLSKVVERAVNDPDLVAQVGRY